MTRPVLRHPNQVPPGGYKYRDADTGFEVKGIDFQQVIRQAAAHRKANHLPIAADFADQALATMCREWGPKWCDYAEPEPLVPELPKRPTLTQRARAAMGRLRVTIDTLMRGTKAYLLLVRGNLATKEQVTQRAQVCAACPLRVESLGCFGCSSIAPKAAKVIGQANYNYAANLLGDHKRLACDGCGCLIPLKLWGNVKMNQDLTPPHVRSRLDPKCWVLREETLHKQNIAP